MNICNYCVGVDRQFGLDTLTIAGEGLTENIH